MDLPERNRLYERLDTQRDEIERLRLSIRAAYDCLHHDNDAASAEAILSTAIRPQPVSNTLNRSP